MVLLAVWHPMSLLEMAMQRVSRFPHWMGQMIDWDGVPIVLAVQRQ